MGVGIVAAAWWAEVLAAVRSRSANRARQGDRAGVGGWVNPSTSSHNGASPARPRCPSDAAGPGAAGVVSAIGAAAHFRSARGDRLWSPDGRLYATPSRCPRPRSSPSPPSWGETAAELLLAGATALHPGRDGRGCGPHHPGARRRRAVGQLASNSRCGAGRRWSARPRRGGAGGCTRGAPSRWRTGRGWRSGSARSNRHGGGRHDRHGQAVDVSLELVADRGRIATIAASAGLRTGIRALGGGRRRPGTGFAPTPGRSWCRWRRRTAGARDHPDVPLGGRGRRPPLRRRCTRAAR
jgi:hypothetical protein